MANNAENLETEAYQGPLMLNPQRAETIRVGDHLLDGGQVYEVTSKERSQPNHWDFQGVNIFDGTPSGVITVEASYLREVAHVDCTDYRLIGIKGHTVHLRSLDGVANHALGNNNYVDFVHELPAHDGPLALEMANRLAAGQVVNVRTISTMGRDLVFRIL
uniref:uncharacterized protein LOC122594085 n=1 Tax=Erigeron canadensis TaxID=72917 RepID=UPI001CB99AAD|nr:uncharacterized protein LOC122594085 [Erigeron canadensis]XP_043622497.1 uncharacterized protein LOC122594085 [Erigeron canadensis]